MDNTQTKDPDICFLPSWCSQVRPGYVICIPGQPGYWLCTNAGDEDGWKVVCELLPPDNIHRPLDRRPVFTFFQSGRLGGNFFGTVRVVALYTELRAWVPNTTIVGAQMDTRLKPKTVPVVDVWELAHRYDFPGTISRKALWYARRNLRRQAQKEAKR